MWLLLLIQTAFGDAMQDLLLASDSNGSVEAREQAFDAVVRQGNTEIQYLLDISENAEQSTRLRWVAIRALGQIKGPQAEQVLLRLVKNSEPAIRTAAASALGDLGNQSHLALVGSLLKDEAVIVRVAAAEALGKYQDPKGVSMLEAALKDPRNQYRGASLWVRAHYVLALGAIQSPTAYPILLQCLSDSDPRVVQSTVSALEMIAGFSLGEGRSNQQEVQAWSRWIQNQLR